MKNRILSLAVLSLLISSIYSCSKEKHAEVTEKQEEISASTLAQIKKLGFNTHEAQKVENGYLVEGDILLTEENLKEAAVNTSLNIAETEQYRTTNIVKNLPRAITVSVTGLNVKFSQALDIVIKRYNDLGLKLKFQRATAGTTGTIDIKGFYQGPDFLGRIVLASGGFPTSSGNPYNQILFNTHSAGYSSKSLEQIAGVLQHEIGHNIGFRHTDYANRAYSCGGSRDNEGQAGVGAIRIPGTPSAPDSESFMLACVGSNPRTFNANDVVALNYLYK